MIIIDGLNNSFLARFNARLMVMVLATRELIKYMVHHLVKKTVRMLSYLMDLTMILSMFLKKFMLISRRMLKTVVQEHIRNG